MTKRIGIVAQYSYGILGVASSYIEWAKKFGTPVVVTPSSKLDWSEIYNLDGLILPGGADVNPKRYAFIKGYWTGFPDPTLEEFDTEILPSLIGRIPIFGICRGLQTLNVVLGGTLRQHLFKHPYSKVPNEHTHQVYNPNNPTKPIGWVNSFHHQCIKQLAPGLTLKLVAHDGTPEAISNAEARIFAVQWHPERLGDPYSVAEFNRILEIK